jgi:hypothetical protein
MKRPFLRDESSTWTGRQLLWFVAAFAIAHIGLADAQVQGGPAVKDEELVLTTISNDRGDSYEYRVSKRRLALTKSWSPESDAPELSIAAALSLAKKQARLTRPENFILTGIQFQPYPLDDNGGVRWYYNISFYNGADVYGDKPPVTQEVIILMNGSIIEPVRVPRQR